MHRNRIRPIQDADAGQVARLHMEGIPTGVLADLGPAFLECLYSRLSRDPGSVVIIAVDQRDEEEVLGFIAGVDHVGEMFRRVLKENWFPLASSSIWSLFSLRIIRRIFNTIRYPSQTEGEFPDPELLSIVVAKSAWGTGLATQLLERVEAEFRNRGVREFKVMVRADFDRANAFYSKHGFELAGKINRHNHTSNIYTKQT